MPVTKIEINSRQPFAEGKSFGEVGAYEQIDGMVHFAVDPEHAANETISDIKLAPRDAQGMVTFTSDFRILQPVDPEKGNQRLLLDILNRGKAPALRNLNSAPDVAPDAPLNPGNGFLMRHGFTVAWCGWQHDVPNLPGIIGIKIPDAVTPQGPVTGNVVVTFQPIAPISEQMLSDRMHQGYPVDNLSDPDAYMTVQDHEDAPEEIVPRDQWSFARLEAGQPVPDANHVYMPSGFQPGKVYQVVYATTGAPVIGLGLLATRDMASFLRYNSAGQGNPCAGNVEHAYTFGVSQSGRFLRLFLHLGLNRDQESRVVFDGFIPHVAGAKKGEFNQRFGQPSSQAARSTNSVFPFSDVAQTDSETGLSDGVLTRSSAQGELPKIMQTYTPSEYWGGHGSLTHIDLDGTRDLELPDADRIYVFSGTQHGLSTFPLADVDADGYRGRHTFNCMDYRPLLRAALINLDRWVTSGEAPPPSSHPRIDNGTAVLPEKAAEVFRTIPGVDLPTPLRRFTRLDFGTDPGVPTKIPPEVGGEYRHMVSAVDQDGNELSGIPMPYLSVPLATYMGWNLRHGAIGGEGQTLSSGGSSGGTLRGSTIPFPATREEREETGDPRLSIEERYQSREHYLSLITQAAQELIAKRYLLEEDLQSIVEQAGEHYDALSVKAPAAQPADD